MIFDPPLLPGRLVRRYKRFLADVELEGRVETVHCANPGSMMGLAEPGSPVWLSRSANPARKLPLTWELVEVQGALGGTLVGINTGYANRLAEEALGRGLIPALAGYPAWRREVAYGAGSRIDFLLTGAGPAALLCRGQERHSGPGRGGGIPGFGHRPGHPASEGAGGDAPAGRPLGDAVPGPAPGLPGLRGGRRYRPRLCRGPGGGAAPRGSRSWPMAAGSGPKGIELAGPLPFAPGMAGTGASPLQNRAPRP